MAFELRDKRKMATHVAFICVFLLTVLYTLVSSSTALAYDKWSQYDAKGWKYISADSKGTDNALDSWNSYEAPHGNFSSGTNRCRTCHALHQANKNSFRLLFNSDRKTECDRCHDPVTGLSGKKPYRLFSNLQQKKGKQNYNGQNSGKTPEQYVLVNGKKIILRNQELRLLEDARKKGEIDVKGKINSKTRRINLRPITPILEAKGEHTLGATVIPDSNITVPSTMQQDGLVCFSCHDPHFSAKNTIKSIPRWKKRGLLKDPGENGGSAEDGLISVGSYDANNRAIDQATTKPSPEEVKSAFCADCHNKNPSWDNGSKVHDNRPNKYTHPIGNVDGEVDVYGKNKSVIIGKTVTIGPRMSCLSCHAASTETDDKGRYTGESSFPHQSKGHKLLFDSYTTESDVLAAGDFGGYTGDPNRPLPGLDEGLCREKCHKNVGLNSPQGF